MRSVGSWEGDLGKEGRKELIVVGWDRWERKGRARFGQRAKGKWQGEGKGKERERPSAGLRLRAKASEHGQQLGSRLISIPGVWRHLDPSVSVHSHLCPCQYGKGNQKKIK